MTEQEFWELIERLQKQGVPLSPEQRRAIEEYLRGKMSPGSIKDFEDGLEKGAEVAKQPWWRILFKPVARGPWVNVARGGVYLALAYLLIAAWADSRVQPKTISGGKGICNTAAGQKQLHVDPSASGPNGALNDALDELERQCTKSGPNCGGSGCPTCAPDVAVQTVDIKTRIFWYTADVTAICQCWCK